MSLRPAVSIAFIALLIGCARDSTSAAHSTAIVTSDSAVVFARILADPRDSGFTIDGFTVASFVDVPFRVASSLLTRDSVARIIVVTIDSRGASKAYDNSISIRGCGDPSPDQPVVDRLYIARRLLLAVQIRRHEGGCPTIATTDFRTVHLLDAMHGFREVFSYQSDSVDFGNPEDANTRRPAYRHTYAYPNVCIEPHACSILEVVSISSERGFKQRVFGYKWNSDSSALVEDSRK